MRRRLRNWSRTSLEFTPGDVIVRHGDTMTSPYSVGTWGSRGITLGGGAAHRAAGMLRDKLIAIAAQHLQAAPDDIELAA